VTEESVAAGIVAHVEDQDNCGRQAGTADSATVVNHFAA